MRGVRGKGKEMKEREEEGEGKGREGKERKEGNLLTEGRRGREGKCHLLVYPYGKYPSPLSPLFPSLPLLLSLPSPLFPSIEILYGEKMKGKRRED